MNRLLAANYARLWKDKVFWVCTVFMIGIGLFFSIQMGEGQKLDNLMFIFLLFIGVVQSVFCSMYIGTEYNDGTIRNKIIIGHKRSTIYAANLIVCFTAGLIFIIAYLIPAGIIGVIRFGWFETKFYAVLLMLLITMLMLMAVTAINTILAMLISNKATCAVICVLSAVVVLFIAVYIKSRLEEPPMYDSYVYTDSSGNIQEEVATPNPNYLTGTKREVYQFMLDFIPTGQCFEILYWKVTSPFHLMLYSMIIVVVSSGIGYVVFRKKDIK